MIKYFSSFRELLDMATENYLRLIRQHVTDYGVLWSTALKKLCAFPGENLIFPRLN